MRTAQRIRTFVCLLVLVSVTLISAASAASGAGSKLARPVIGIPIASPKQPAAGKAFSVSYKVTAGGSAAALSAVRLTFSPTIDGRTIPHTQSFSNGKARGQLVVPASAAGKLLTLTLTVRANNQLATKVASFRVGPPQIPSLAVADASAAEGNSGTSALSFVVTLSATATQTVTVRYATSDGTATAPADYVSAGGALTFQPGETSKSIAVSVVGDAAIEPDETLTLTISDPTNASIKKPTATGTITNDDVAAAIAPGTYKGATQEGNFVFFTVLTDRTVTGFRVNDVAESCQPGGRITGGVDWGKSVFPILTDGSFTAQGSWSGSDVQGDAEYTSESWTVTGSPTSATSFSGRLTINDGLKYKESPVSCSSSVTWTATLQS